MSQEEKDEKERKEKEREEKRQAFILRVVSSLEEGGGGGGAEEKKHGEAGEQTPTHIHTVLTALVQGVADSSIAVGQFSADALLNMLKTPTYTPTPTPALPEIATKIFSALYTHTHTPALRNDTVLQLRYADLVAHAISLPSPAILEAATHTHTHTHTQTEAPVEILFNLIEGETGRKDVLIQFSALELLESVAHTHTGAHYLFSRGTVK